MADPTKFVPGFDYSDFEQSNPTLPKPGGQLDNDFANIQQSVNQTVDAIKDIRRSDGKLKNQSVGPDQLSPALNIGFTNRGEWTIGETYSAGDGVAYDAKFYSARVMNVATADTRPDLNPAVWMYLFSVTDVAIPDDSIDRGKLKLDVQATLGKADNALIAYPTVVGMPALEIPIGTNTIRVNGYYAAGDGGGHTKVKIPAPLIVQPWHIQTADGAWWDIAETSVNVLMFGARGDGATDNKAAFDKIPPTADVFIPAGEYILSGAWNKKYGMVHGVGTQSALVFTGGTDGIVFSPDANETTSGVMDMGIWCKGQNGGKAISTPRNSDQYFVYRSNFQYHRVDVGGYTKVTPGSNIGFETVESWSFCLDQGDAWNVGVSEFDGYGSWRIDQNPVGQYESTFIRLGSDAPSSAVLTAHLSAITCAAFKTFLDVGPRAFFNLESFDCAHCHDGIIQSSDGTVSYDESRVRNGNLNVQHRGIYFEGVNSRGLFDIICRRHRNGWKGGSTPWIGFNLVDCSLGQLHNLFSQPDESGTTFPEMQYHMVLTGCGLTPITACTAGASVDVGMRLDNCNALTIDNTHSAQGAVVGPSAVLFELVNNTRSITIGAYEVVSTFAGQVITRDASVTGQVQMLNKTFELMGGTLNIDMRTTLGAADAKRWRTSVGAAAQARQTVSDAGSVTNYEIVTRSGVTVTQIEWRANAFKFNNGSTLTFSAASPEGAVTAPPGSLHINTSTSGRLYVKESGTGNTGWVVK